MSTSNSNSSSSSNLTLTNNSPNSSGLGLDRNHILTKHAINLSQPLSSLSTSQIFALLDPIILRPNQEELARRFTNWAKTFSCVPGLVFTPQTIPQIKLIVTLAHRLGKQLRAVGAGHSPSDLACVDSRSVNPLVDGVFGVGGDNNVEPIPNLEDLVDLEEWAGQDGGWMIRMQGLSEVYSIDNNNVNNNNEINNNNQNSGSGSGSSPVIHVQSGILLHNLHAYLAQCTPPLAMSNIGSISDQTLGGIIATASHGSGWDYGVMSEMCLELGVVVGPGCLREFEIEVEAGDGNGDGNGEFGEVRIVRCRKGFNEELFMACLCGLGMTGLIIDVKLKVEPAFRLRESKISVPFSSIISTTTQEPYSDDPSKQQQSPNEIDEESYTGGAIDEIARSAEHVRLWWYPQVKGVIIGRANRTYDPAPPSPNWIQRLKGNIYHFFNYHVTEFLLYIAIFIPNFTKIVGKWAWFLISPTTEINDSYKIFTFDCLYAQYTTEWSIPYHLTRPCLLALEEWLEGMEKDPKGQRIHFPIEIRFVKEDGIWLSPAYGRRTTYIGMVQYKPYGCPVPYEELLGGFSKVLASFQGRPHWAKQHDFASKEFRQLYPKFDDFKNLVKELDPEGMWGCEYTRRHVTDEEEVEKMKKI